MDVIDLSTGTFRVRWRDINLSRRDSLLVSWRVIYCPASVAGNASGGQQWSDRVMRLGLGIHETHMRGAGEELEYIHSDLQKPDGWVVVTGISETGLVGFPSEPAFVRLDGSTTALSNEVTNVAMSYSFQLTPENYEVMKLSPSYVTPADMTNFHGVHLHSSGLYGAGVYKELNSVNVSQGRPGGSASDQWIMHVARDSGLGSGTATMNSGSAAVARVTGTNFDAAWVARRMMIENPTSDTWFDSGITAVADVNNLTLTSPYPYATGIRRWVVLNAITFYFVSVSVRGSRRADFTLAPSVTI